MQNPKYIVLGVSFSWGRRKGLDVFKKLAEDLPPEYRILMVGVDANIRNELPPNITTIPRTSSKEEMAEIYTAADVFVNPTREDTFPTVNIESLACGTPVITFCTGGSPEIIDDTCGIAVPVDDYEALKDAIKKTCENGLFSKECCLKRAECFNKLMNYRTYVKLYNAV